MACHSRYSLRGLRKIVTRGMSSITYSSRYAGPNYTSMLFAKARRFDELLDPTVKVQVLSCQMPHSNGQYYVFEEDDVAHIVRKAASGPSRMAIVVTRVA